MPSITLYYPLLHTAPHCTAPHSVVQTAECPLLPSITLYYTLHHTALHHTVWCKRLNALYYPLLPSITLYQQSTAECNLFNKRAIKPAHRQYNVAKIHRMPQIHVIFRKRAP